MKNFKFRACGMNFCRAGFSDAYRAWKVSERSVMLGNDALCCEVRRTSIMCYLNVKRIYNADGFKINPPRLNYFFSARITTEGAALLNNGAQATLDIAIACRWYLAQIDSVSNDKQYRTYENE